MPALKSRRFWFLPTLADNTQGMRAKSFGKAYDAKFCKQINI
jgi:hypothetical protein